MTALLALVLLLGADDRVDRLPTKYKTWIEKEVVYIIANREREAFLDLESEEEWEAFVNAFWQRRDPDAVTPINEFKEEHYRRIDLANKFMGRESAVPGWLTDRGKMYIILGEPHDREEFTSVPYIYPAELWFYQANRDKALPPLYLLFWQEHHAGPYRLFNQLLDQPEDLMPMQPFQSDDSRREAFSVLQEINPSLAHSTITMRADRGVSVGLQQPASSGLDFQTLLSDINASPFRRVDTRYVDAADEARGLVESNYLFNFIPSSGMVNVLPGPGGTSFVHFSIEIQPQDMTLAHDPDKGIYYTTLDLRGEVTAPDGETVVHGFSTQPYIQLTESQFRDVGYRAFAYRDMFPIMTGEYQFRLVFKNQARSEYSIVDFELDVPERPAGVPYLGTPVPLYGMAKLNLPENTEPLPYRTYQMGATSLDPNAKRTVAIGNYLMTHIPVENAEGHGLQLTVLSLGLESGVEDAEAEPTVALEERHDLALYERPVVLRTPLTDLTGGHYRLVVELKDPAEATIETRIVNFDISPLATIHRAWAVRESINGEQTGLVSATLALQASRLGRQDEARALAEEALSQDPNIVPARLMLARFHLDDGAPIEAVKLLEPARAQQPRNAEVLLALGDAHFQLGNYARAAELLETAAELRRPDTELLNALGICRAQLGDTEQAIGYFKRSLELDPSQEQIKSLLDQIQTTGNE